MSLSAETWQASEGAEVDRLSGPRERPSQSSVSPRLRHGPIHGESRAGVTGGGGSGGGVLGGGDLHARWGGLKAGLKCIACVFFTVLESVFIFEREDVGVMC